MRPLSILFTLSFGIVVTAAAQQAPGQATGVIVQGQAPVQLAPAVAYKPGRSIGMRPEQKRPLTLRKSERNPYAHRSPGKDASSDNEDNVEELQIREKLSALSVSGKSQGTNSLRILLGDIIIEKGAVLPPLLEDQSENLQVIEITDDALLLGWLDIETGELTGKTMQVAYDIRPNVAYALHGQKHEADGGIQAARRMGLIRVREGNPIANSSIADSAPEDREPKQASREDIDAGENP